MGKTLIILLMTTFIHVQSSQAFQTGKFNKGIKLGLNKSRYHSDVSSETYELKDGLCGGIFINFRINKFIFLQPECLYTSKGAENEVIIYAEHTDDQGQPIILAVDMQTSYIDYIEFPFLLKILFSTKSLISPVLYFGPYYSIELNTKYKRGVWGEGDLMIKNNDVGVIAGFGIDLNTRTLPLTFEARYVYGMSELEENSVTEIKNEVFTVMLGFYF